jgi:hypothetical protein
VHKRPSLTFLPLVRIEEINLAATAEYRCVGFQS